jgi:nucleotide-binding universal stress UspA family protein
MWIRKMFQKALVPVDGSPITAGLVAYAIGFAKKAGCSLTFLYVVDLPQTVPAAEVEKQKAANMKIPEQSREKAAEEGLSSSSMVEIGKPAETVICMADREKFDLIILGSRGHSRLKRLIVGSVADKVMEHAPCPVLIFR